MVKALWSGTTKGNNGIGVINGAVLRFVEERRTTVQNSILYEEKVERSKVSNSTRYLLLRAVPISLFLAAARPDYSDGRERITQCRRPIRPGLTQVAALLSTKNHSINTCILRSLLSLLASSLPLYAEADHRAATFSTKG